ncbi:hypothetical protein QBC44DRAFT_252748 [Cladorrhinum sp. PSN332]|nr:hypothetical protein QBC44DRAFT_252748 [Cladorrhinum sp. PSN332]
MSKATGQRWNQLLEDKLNELNAKDKSRLTGLISYDAFDEFLGLLLANYKKKREMRILDAIKPAVEGLETFTKGLNSISQGNPFASIAWGAAQILLEVSRRNVAPSLASKIEVELINLVKVYWNGGQVKRNFDKAKANVEDRKVEFEREVNWAHIEQTNQIHAALAKAPGSEPKVSKATTLPFGRNASFVCRDHVLKQIEDGLHKGNPSSRPGTRSCVVHGMGGVGKTQTSLEFAYRHAKPNCSIFWLRAETPTELAESFSRIAKALNLAKDSDIQDQTQLVTLAQQWLSREPNWLLIFDNVIDQASIKSYWPAHDHGWVLVTTQNRDVVHMATFGIHLTTMLDDEGAKLLLRHLEYNSSDSSMYQDDVETAKVVSRELEGLPIAIAHVAGYIGKLGRPLSYFLDQFRERRQASRVWSMDSRNTTTPQYERTLATVWDMALSVVSPEARFLIDVMAMLSPDSIPEEMLLSDATTKQAPVDYDFVRMELLSRHLVRIQGASNSALSIHRSFQKNLVFRLDQTPQDRQQVFDRAVKLVRNCFPVQSPIGVPVSHKWDDYKKYLPHVLSLHTMYRQTTSPPGHEIEVNAGFAELLCDAGYYMWDRNIGSEGISVLETADKICHQLNSTADGTSITPSSRSDLRRLRANIGVALGSLLNTLGISEIHRAINLFDEILILRQEHISSLSLPHSQEDQLLLSNSWNDKGWMRLESEDYLAAEECFEKSLEIKRQWPEKDIPFEFSETLKNLAMVRMAQKRSKEAIDLALHALKLVEEDENGTGPATVLKFKLYTAEVLMNSGQVGEAIKLAKEVASGRQSLYRDHHPLNLDVYYFLGIAHFYGGNLTEAAKMLQQSLRTDDRDPYPDECRARSLYALSEVLSGLGDTIEAPKHRREAFSMMEKWRHLFLVEVSDATHESVLFDHVVPLKCTRLSRHGKMWVGTIR